MKLDRAIRLAQTWTFGGVCTLSEGEAQEYHKLALTALRAQAEAEKNEPLTLDELLKMHGEPIWYQLKDGQKGYGLVIVEESEQTIFIAGINGFLIAVYVYGEPNECLGAKLYRRKPEEGG